MELKVKLDEKELQDKLGEMLKAIILRKVDAFSKTYNNPLDQIVEKEMSALIFSILREDYQEEMSKIIREKIDAGLIQEVMDRAFEQFLQKFWS